MRVKSAEIGMGIRLDIEIKNTKSEDGIEEWNQRKKYSMCI